MFNFVRGRWFWIALGTTLIILILWGGGGEINPQTMTPNKDYNPIDTTNYSGLINGWMTAWTTEKPNTSIKWYEGRVMEANYHGLIKQNNEIHDGFILNVGEGHLNVSINAKHPDSRLEVSEGRYGLIYKFTAPVKGRAKLVDSELYVKPTPKKLMPDLSFIWGYKYYALLTVVFLLILKYRKRFNGVEELSSKECMDILKKYLIEERDASWVGWGEVFEKNRDGVPCYLIEFYYRKGEKKNRGYAYISIHGGFVKHCTSLFESKQKYMYDDETRRSYSRRWGGRPPKKTEGKSKSLIKDMLTKEEDAKK